MNSGNIVVRFEGSNFHLHRVGVIGPRTNLREAKEILQRGKSEGKSTERRRTALYEIAKGIITYFLRSRVAA